MRKTKKMKIGRSVVFGVAFVIFLIYAISLIWPIIWTFLLSLKTSDEYKTTNVMAFPKAWEFKNYIAAWKALDEVGESGAVNMLFNSLWYTAGGVLAGVSVSTMVAYAVAKYRFPGRDVIYWTAIVTMMIPIVGAMPSQHAMYTQLGIIDSPLLLIAFTGGFGSNFIILYSFFKSLPSSYIEAAFIDGSGHFKAFVNVMLPQALPVIASISVVAAIGFWNDYNTPLLFLKSYPTLASGLQIFQVIYSRKDNSPVLFAGILLLMFPVLVLFILFQNSIMDLSLGGGLKG